MPCLSANPHISKLDLYRYPAPSGSLTEDAGKGLKAIQRNKLLLRKRCQDDRADCWDDLQGHIRTRATQETCQTLVHSHHMAAVAVGLDRTLGCHGTSLAHMFFRQKGIHYRYNKRILKGQPAYSVSLYRLSSKAR